MSSRTLFLSRLIGLYCILVALSMMTRKQATVETVTALVQNPSMMLILGVITLAAGLAMVLAHNIWSGGALTVIVTLVGWITLVKSLFFLFLPPELEAGFFLRQLPMKNLNAWFVLVKPDHGVAAKAVQDGEIVDGVDFFVGETAGFGWMCRAGAASDVRQGEPLSELRHHCPSFKFGSPLG